MCFKVINDYIEMQILTLKSSITLSSQLTLFEASHVCKVQRISAMTDFSFALLLVAESVDAGDALSKNDPMSVDFSFPVRRFLCFLVQE